MCRAGLLLAGSVVLLETNLGPPPSGLVWARNAPSNLLSQPIPEAAEASPSTARAEDKAAGAEAEASASIVRAEDMVAWAEDNGAEALPLTRGDEIGKAQDTEEDTEEEYKNWNCFPSLAVQLGHNGVISVLFETPSGFAIFNYDGVKLLLPNADKHIWTDFVYEDRAKEVVWLTKFQPFEDKASAIIDTGVDERLSTMIKQCLKPDQKLAVGSERYKNIIDKTMGICCLHDDAVMELLWGLKYCMHHLVPGETKVDRLLTCKGMITVLDKYHFDYKPEMVTDDLIELLCVVYNSDYCVDMHFETLHAAGKQLMDVSKINCEDWDLLKLVTALKWVCYPKEKLFPDPEKIFSEEERITLERDAPKYKDKLWGNAILVTYNQIVRARLIRNKWLGQLPNYLKEAEDACKAKQEDA